MRNALGLMLASVGAAVVIAAVWFWTSSPRADSAVAATVGAPRAERLAATASAKPVPIPEDADVTAVIPAKPPVRPQPKSAEALAKVGEPGHDESDKNEFWSADIPATGRGSEIPFDRQN